MTKQQFRAVYREARKFDRFQHFFWDRLRKHPDLSFETVRACPGFTASRLHGDSLRFPINPDYRKSRISYKAVRS